MKIRIASLALFVAAGLMCSSVARADELDDAYQALKDAQTAKNADDVLKWAPEASKLARAITEASRLEYAKQVDAFAEYSLSATLVAQTDAAKQAALGDALVELNPKSQYLPQCTGAYLAAVAKSGGADKQVAAARKIVAGSPNSEDALFALATGLMQKQPGQAAQFASRLTTVLRTKAKPEGVSEADWDRRKTTLLGQGYYIAGAGSCAAQAWADCDRNLRAAIPFVGKDPTMGGTTYFYLGLANYNLGKAGNIIIDRSKVMDGQKFSEQAAAMPGPMQSRAATNAAAMKQDLAGPRR
jgi:hypothetical protein